MTEPGSLPSWDDLLGTEPDVFPSDLRAEVLHQVGLADAPARRHDLDAPDTTELRRELGL